MPAQGPRPSARRGEQRSRKRERGAETAFTLCSPWRALVNGLQEGLEVLAFTFPRLIDVRSPPRPRDRAVQAPRRSPPYPRRQIGARCTAKPHGAAGPAVPPRSVFPFRVRCGFRRSLVLGSWLLTVCGPSRRRPFRVEQSRREPGCRPVGLRRNGAAFAPSPPVLARESSPACGFSTGSVDGQTARPSG